MSATNRNISYPRCKAKNHRHSVDAHCQIRGVSVMLSPLPIKAAIHRLCKTATKLLLNYGTYKTTNRWRSVDAHFNVLSIQHLLPVIIVFITIWTSWFLHWQNETRPCGKADRSNILALFALTRLKYIYLAKRFIVPAIDWFLNWCSQATAPHLPIIYL